MILGLLGAALIVLDGVLDAVGGAIFLVVGHGLLARGFWERSVLFLVVGCLMGFFALLGRSRGSDRSLTSGAVLVVLVVAGWLVLGLSSGVLALLGSVLVLVAGVLFLLSGR
ncbi:MAG: hypothetical protein ABSB97_03170 [Thermoplasmata archaeon]|jgi:hypothetical protein